MFRSLLGPEYGEEKERNKWRLGEVEIDEKQQGAEMYSSILVMLKKVKVKYPNHIVNTEIMKTKPEQVNLRNACQGIGGRRKLENIDGKMLVNLVLRHCKSKITYDITL